MITNHKETPHRLNALTRLGWGSHFQTYQDIICNDKRVPARVVGVHKNRFLINDGNKETLATVAGRLTHKKEHLFPVIGDWVLAADKVISDILPRKNALSRSAAGAHGKQGLPSNKEQVLAANLDTVFIVSGIDRDFNLRRIERYLTLVYNCGLTPVIILTKADLDQTPELFVQKVEAVAFGVPVHLVSAHDSHGLILLETYLSEGQTVSMVGSSGAGKSTLVNRLCGKTVQPTSRVSEAVGKGRHTTTHRSLILMPQGGMVIDNPGIREIGFSGEGGGLDAAFPEIEHLARTCRFQDCSHTHEPGCQVRHGADTGLIRPDRLKNYQKMKRELAYLMDRQQKSADRIEKERWKGVALKIRSLKKNKP